MDIYKTKNYLELFCLFVYHKLSLNDFWKMFQLNSYKFKRDVRLISGMAPHFGVSVVVEENSISVRIDDPDLFYAKNDACIAFYHIYKTRPEDNLFTISMIGQVLLLSEEPLKIEDICSLVSTSRSGIRNELVRCRSIIESYNIKIENVPYYGIRVTGDEFRIRLCLLPFLISADYNIIIHPPISPLADQLLISQDNEEWVSAVRDQLNILLTQYCMDVPSEFRKQILGYMIIQKQRISMRKYVAETLVREDDLLAFRTTEAYQIANILFRNHFSVEDGEIDKEIISLAAVICIFQDHLYGERTDFLSCWTLDYVLNYLSKEWGIDIQGPNDTSFQFIYKFCMRLVVNSYFNTLSCKRFSPHTNLYAHFYSTPYLAYIAMDMKNGLEEYLSSPVRHPFMNEIFLFLLRWNMRKSPALKKVDFVVYTRDKWDPIFLTILEALDSQKFIADAYIISSVDELRSYHRYVMLSDFRKVNEHCFLLDHMDRAIEFVSDIDFAIRQAVCLDTDMIGRQTRDVELDSLADKDIQQKLAKLCGTDSSDAFYTRVDRTVILMAKHTFEDPSRSAFLYSGAVHYIGKEKAAPKNYICVLLDRSKAPHEVLCEMLRVAVRGEEEIRDFHTMSVDEFANKYLRHLIR